MKFQLYQYKNSESDIEEAPSTGTRQAIVQNTHVHHGTLLVAHEHVVQVTVLSFLGQKMWTRVILSHSCQHLRKTDAPERTKNPW